MVKQTTLKNARFLWMNHMKWNCKITINNNILSMQFLNRKLKLLSYNDCNKVIFQIGNTRCKYCKQRSIMIFVTIANIPLLPTLICLSNFDAMQALPFKCKSKVIGI